MLGKTIIAFLKFAVQEGAEYAQLCTGYEGGWVVGVHKMLDIFSNNTPERTLQVEN